MIQEHQCYMFCEDMWGTDKSYDLVASDEYFAFLPEGEKVSCINVNMDVLILHSPSQPIT